MSRSDHALLNRRVDIVACRLLMFHAIGLSKPIIALQLPFKSRLSVNGSQRHGIDGLVRFNGSIDRVRDSLRDSSRDRQWKCRTDGSASSRHYSGLCEETAS